jgi:hypothetical protein
MLFVTVFFQLGDVNDAPVLIRSWQLNNTEHICNHTDGEAQLRCLVPWMDVIGILL